MWADKNGRHILGLIEDYNALRKQISEGQKLVSEMEAPLRKITGMKHQEPGVKVNIENEQGKMILPSLVKHIDQLNATDHGNSVQASLNNSAKASQP